MTRALILVFVVEYIKGSHIFFIRVLMGCILLLFRRRLTYRFIEWRRRLSLNRREWIGLRLSGFGACEAEVSEVILVSEVIDFMIFVNLGFTVDMIPLVALIAHEPVLSICDVRVSIVVNLLAEVTVLALVVRVCAYLA